MNEGPPSRSARLVASTSVPGPCFPGVCGFTAFGDAPDVGARPQGLRLRIPGLRADVRGACGAGAARACSAGLVRRAVWLRGLAEVELDG